MYIQFFFLFLYSLTLHSLALHAQDHPDEETGKHVQNTRQNWNFELYNKSEDTIWFSLYFPKWVLNKWFITYRELEPGNKIRLVIKLEDNPVIQIWKKDYPTNFRRERKPTVERQLEPCIGHHAKIIGIQCSRTAFLTFDQNNALRPQTGPAKGFSTITESGLDRMRNISRSGIRAK